MTERLARASSRRPWLVVGLWVVAVLAAAVTVATLLEFEGEAEVTRQTDSKRAEQGLDQAFRRDVQARDRAITEVVVVRADGGAGEARPARERVDALADELRTAGATRVVTSADDPGLVSSDGDATALLVALGRDGEGDVDGIIDAVQRVDDEPG